MLRALKFTAFVVINLVIALIGTAMLDHGLWGAIPPPSNSVTGVIWKELLLSLICAAGLGFGVWRIWRTSAAKYVWIPATVWFAIGFIAIAGHGVMGRLSPLGSGGSFGPAEVRSFFAFTVPLIRSISYSLGSYLSSSLSATQMLQARRSNIHGS